MGSRRYSVLTYIIGNSEPVHEIGERDPDAEYLLVTDSPEVKSETWEVVLDDAFQGLSASDRRHSIAYDCFRYCHTDVCLRIDPAVQIHRSTKWLADEFEKGAYHMALMPHPLRDDIREEYEAWIGTTDYPREQAERCMASMASRGYDFAYRGLFHGGFAIMRRDEQTRDLNREVLAWLKELGDDGKMERLDHTVFSCVVNMRHSNLKILPLSEQLFHSEMMTICFHGTEIESKGVYYDLFSPDVKQVFDRPVECRYFMVGGRETRELRKLYSEVEDLGYGIWALLKKEAQS